VARSVSTSRQCCCDGLEPWRDEVAGWLDARPFEPALWARNPHLQTIWGPLVLKRRPAPLLRVEELATPDRDRLLVYHLDAVAGAPRALILHGLEGDRHSYYVSAQLRELARRGWAATVLEFRSCSGAINLGRRLYHSGETSDLNFVVAELIGRGEQSLYLSGVSLGANVVLKWLGEQGERLPEAVRGAAAISPPFDLTLSGPAIDRALGGLYVRRFLRTLIAKAIAKERQYPGCLDVEAVRGSRTFEAFDTYATAALHGFRDAFDYWHRSGCGQFLRAIRRPTLLIAAADDPFNPAAGIPSGISSDNPYLVESFHSGGGHVGFIEGPPWASRSWATARTVEFFGLIAQRQGARSREG
jgi:hypothetical protein